MKRSLAWVRWLGAMVSFLAAVAGASAPSAATTDEQVEASIKKGVALRRAGNDEAALPEFKKAYDLSHSARAAGQVGLCEQALGLWAEAHDHLVEALQSPDDAWVKKNRAVLEEQVAAANGHVGRVEINGEPAGAQVYVNGRPVGRLPLDRPLKLATGRIRIELRAPSHLSAEESVDLKPGAYERVGIRLVRSPEPATGASSSERPVPTTIPEPAVALAAAPPSTSETSEPSTQRRAWVWAAIAAVAIGGAVTAFLVSRSGGSQDVPHLTLGPDQKGIR